MHKFSAYRPTHTLLTSLLLLGVFLSALGLPQSARATPFYVRDQFDVNALTNNNGNVNWATNWIETNDDGTAAGGDVRITGNQLRINNNADAGLESIERGVNLSSAATASLSFYFSTAALEAGDSLILEVYNGTVWTTLETFTGNYAAARRTYDITSYRNTNTRIRFRLSAGYTVNDEFFYADKIEVAYTDGGTHTSTSVLQTVQTYYIPVPEDQALQFMVDVENGSPSANPPVSPTFVYVSITITTDGTVIYYDHWEDGFDASINDPQQTTSDVWGDNNMVNGVPPGYATDYLNAGDIIILTNVVDVDAAWPTPKVLKYDGGDKLASTQAIAVTRTSWASGSGTLHGGSVEMLDTSIWGTRFDVPADSGDQANDFDYAGMSVMATEDNTLIYLNGTQVMNVIGTQDYLDEGQSYLFADGSIVGGDKITSSASHPIQANFLTGNIASNFESSWDTLYPFALLSSNYYAPVDTNGGVNTAVYLQNPNASSITIHWTTTAGAQTDVVVAAGATARIVMPAIGSGARFYTGTGISTDPVFQAISAIDSGGQANDWGYTLIPSNQLTQQAQVGWGVGRDPTSGTLPNENGSPVWVLAVGSGTMYVCADYDGDGVGALTDNNGQRYDQLLTVTNLQRTKVFDTDGDQTGMLLYLCNGSEAGNVNRIAVAWGQDPATATAGAPGLDVGTSVPPLPNFTAIKNAALTDDVNGDGKFDIGDTFEYQIVISNVGALPISGNTITVSDIIPTYTTYVLNSTALDGVSIADSGSGTPFPLDSGGYLIPSTLPIDGSFVVSFRVLIDPSIPGSTTIQNDAHVSGLNLTYIPKVEIIVDPPTKIGDFIWLDIDGDGVQDAGEPGIPGVIVDLYDAAGTTLLATQTSDSNGQYTFSGLTVSTTYTVKVRTASLPGGLTQTGDPDSACPSAGCNSQHQVALGTTPYYAADFGYRGNVSIGDFVWYDIDRDGVQDGGSEVGLNGVTVNLTWAGLDANLATTADNISFTMVTNSGGAYNFIGLPVGIYRVDLDEITLPANYSVTTTDPITTASLTAGTNYATADFGAAPGATISDFVWNDLDADGVQDAGEGGISGVRVYIDADNDNTYDVGERYDITDANGLYAITNLTPATYNVRVDATTLPASTTQTYDLNGGLDHEASVTVTAGQVRTDVDFGYQLGVLSIAKSSNVGSLVYPGDTITYTMLVRNNSGATQDRVSVRDFLPAGTSYVANSTTATLSPYYSDDFSSGGYTGSGPGSLTWGSNWTETDNANNDISVVTDANCPSGQCLRFRLRDAGDIVYRQADLSIPACVSPAVVTLRYDYSNQLIGAADTLDVRIYTGATQRRTVATYTSSNTGSGSVSFNLVANEIANNTRIGLYRVADNNNNFFYFDNVSITCSKTWDNIPAGVNPDLDNGTPPDLVKYEDNFTLTAGQGMVVTFQAMVNNPVALTSIDNTASVYSTQQPTAQESSVSDPLPLGSITGIVQKDNDHNGTPDAVFAGVTLTLYNDMNADGIINGADAAVTFDVDSVTAGTQSSVVSAADGTYTFANVPPGSYIVVETQPAGYLTVSQSDTVADVPVNPADAATTTDRIPVNLVAGETDSGNRFIEEQYATISGLVQKDTDNNDTGDTAFAGVTLTLYTDANGDGIVNGADAAVTFDVDPGTAGTQSSVISAADGSYTLANVPPGVSYIVVETQPAAYQTVSQSDTVADVPVNPADAATGTDRIPVTPAAGETDSGNTFIEEQLGSITGQVQKDTDNNDTGDAIFAGVTLTLYTDANGDGIVNGADAAVTFDVDPGTAGTQSSVVSAAGTGAYTFANVPPGSYIVVEAQPASYGTVSQSDTVADVPVNPADAATGTDRIPVNLAAGETDSGNTFVEEQLGSITGIVQKDNDHNGTPDAVFAGVTLTLYNDVNADGIVNGADAAVIFDVDSVAGGTQSFVVSAADGAYTLSNVPPGSYIVVETQPVGYLSVSQSDTTVDSPLTPADAAITVNNIPVNLATGETDSGNRFIEEQYATIGDFVWNDLNANGIQDGGETGIVGATVNLLNTSGVLQQTTATNSSGIYSFTADPGTYIVEFVTPSGYVPSPIDQGGNDATDSDANVSTGRTTTVTLTAGTNDTSVDAGFYQPKNFGHLPTTLFAQNGHPLVDPSFAGMNMLANGGAWHLNGTTYLGSRLPGLGADAVELDGVNSSTYIPEATDDGVTWTPSIAWTAGGTGSVNVTVECPTATCYLYAWFDWNRDGDFGDTGETITFTTTGHQVSDGLNTLTFSIPAAAYLDGSTLYSRFRIYPLDPTNPQPDGPALDGSTLLVGEIEDPFFQINNGSVPTPVTLSYFTAQRVGASGKNSDNITFTWSTATETGNVGFNLYVKSGQNLVQINKTLIPSRVIDSLDRQDYAFTAVIKGSIFYIEDVSVLGETERHGPFKIGEKYGERLDADRIDHAAVQAEHKEKYDEHQDEIKQEITIPEAVFEAASEQLATPTSTPTATATPCRKGSKRVCAGTVTKTPTPTPTATLCKKGGNRACAGTATPSPTTTPTHTTTPTATPTATMTPTATGEPTATHTPIATDEPTATLTSTATDESTETPTPTATGESIDNGEPTATPTSTETDGTADEPTATPTHTETPTDEPTVTPTATPTGESTPTPTAVDDPTVTPTAMPTGESTATPMSTITDEPTATPTSIPTVEPTATPTTEPVDPQLAVTFNFKVRKTGLYRVTYEMLRDAGLDLAGVPSMNIALANRGKAVPVYVNTQTETFGAGSFIEFYGEALDTIYTDTNIYTLQVSDTSVEKIQRVNAEPNMELTPPDSYTETLTVNNQRKYSSSSPGSNAWYDTAMFVTSTSKNWSFPFQVNGLVNPSAPATFELVVWGMTTMPQTPDHHLLVNLNGVPLANVTFDGMIEHILTINLPAGTLREGANTLQLTLPADTGAQSDIIYLDKFSINYQRLFLAQSGRLTFSAAGGIFTVTNLPSQNVIVYRMDSTGVVHLEGVQVQSTGSTFSASFAGTNEVSTYVVTTAESLFIPVMEATRLQADLSHPAQYLIISHPDFINGLQPLVQARQAQGLTVSVVDVTDLYTEYAYGIFDPQAIQKYIAYAAQNLGTQYVLLVGGDTSDYRNYLGKNSISFIPSLYVHTSSAAKFVPVDPLYADLNADNVPDLAIGRFPVRSTAELDLMINKTLAYAGKNYGRTAVFASDVNDGIVSFKNISLSMSTTLPAGWSVENIHLDDLGAPTARTQLLAAMNRGAALVNFTGHSGPASWTFSNLFNTNDAAALTNIGRPFVVVQWGCWNTYYVDPVNNFLVQKFLFSGDRGAAAVLGASTLTDSESERLLGELLTPRLVTQGMSIGQAMQDAKHELAQSHPELLDVLLGWSLMGDPALVIEP